MISPGLFRLMLATSVVLLHFTRISIGATSVDLFFTLSGYWIYRMFSAKYVRADHPNLLFIASRLARLLPVFWMFNLAINLWFIAAGNTQFAQGSIWTKLIPNILIIGYSSMPGRALTPAWSLDIELQFYLLFPLIYLYLDRLQTYVRLILTAAFVLGGIYVTWLLHDDGAALVFPYAGFFLLGVFTAKNKWVPPKALVRASAFVPIGVLAVVIIVPSLRGIVINQYDPEMMRWNYGFNYGLALLFTPLALSTVYVKSSQTDRVVGDLSFVVYCSHWLAVTIAAEYLTHMGIVTKGLSVASLIVVTYILSYFVLIYFDRPISQWRERWIARHLRPKLVPGATELPQPAEITPQRV